MEEFEKSETLRFYVGIVLVAVYFWVLDFDPKYVVFFATIISIVGSLAWAALAGRVYIHFYQLSQKLL